MNAAFPKVSLLVLTYQQRALLDSAVASAFAQDCEPIEIGRASCRERVFRVV